MVLRRIDVLLEPTKAAVLQKKEFCDCHNLVDYTPFLTQVTGYPFYNTSAFTMMTLKNEIDPQRLKMNIIEYFNGFSQDVQDIIDKFKLRQQVDNLTEAGRPFAPWECLSACREHCCPLRHWWQRWFHPASCRC